FSLFWTYPTCTFSSPTRRSSDLIAFDVAENLRGRRSDDEVRHLRTGQGAHRQKTHTLALDELGKHAARRPAQYACGLRVHAVLRSEEHTSELQSRENLVCRLLLE